MKKLSRILRIFSIISIFMFLVISTLLIFKANSVYEDVWSKESFVPIEWADFSKGFKVVAEFEFNRRSASLLFAKETMSKYNKTRAIGQLEHHFLGAIVSLYCRVFVSDEKALPKIIMNSYLGSGIYGFPNASRYYLGKDIREINLAEAALLFAIWTAPGKFNPVLNIKYAYEGRNRILEKLFFEEVVSKEELRLAIRTPIGLSSINH